jgi:hypothetical protein
MPLRGLHTWSCQEAEKIRWLPEKFPNYTYKGFKTVKEAPELYSQGFLSVSKHG